MNKLINKIKDNIIRLLILSGFIIFVICIFYAYNYTQNKNYKIYYYQNNDELICYLEANNKRNKPTWNIIDNNNNDLLWYDGYKMPYNFKRLGNYSIKIYDLENKKFNNILDIKIDKKNITITEYGVNISRIDNKEWFDNIENDIMINQVENIDEEKKFFVWNNMNEILCADNSLIDCTYAWYITDLETKEDIYKGKYNNDNTFSYTFNNDGKYKIKVFEKLKNGEKKSINITNVNVKNNLCKFENINTDTEIIKSKDEILEKGNIYSKFIPHISKKEMEVMCYIETLGNEIDNIHYAWYIVDAENNENIFKGKYTENSNFKYEFKKTGKYIIKVFMKDLIQDTKLSEVVAYVHVESNICQLNVENTKTIVDD